MTNRFARRRSQLGHARQAGLLWRKYLTILGICLAILVMAALTPPYPLKEFEAGLLVGGAIMLVSTVLLRVDDPQVRGEWAEEWSVQELRKVRGWRVLDNLPFQGVDVDHVVVTPSTVLAVETKYHQKKLPDAYAHGQLARDTAAAAAAARKIESFLRAQKLLHETTVTPVLMVWGGGARNYPTDIASKGLCASFERTDRKCGLTSSMRP